MVQPICSDTVRTHHQRCQSCRNSPSYSPRAPPATPSSMRPISIILLQLACIRVSPIYPLSQSSTPTDPSNPTPVPPILLTTLTPQSPLLKRHPHDILNPMITSIQRLRRIRSPPIKGNLLPRKRNSKTTLRPKALEITHCNGADPLLRSLQVGERSLGVMPRRMLPVTW
ncbi:hypothetical protein BJY04DRAFT_42439 [Aspergillus karnatakaensis]|uniref:uncharacterized protein n=1 Tax=Aspergillus karnatakaensis TaxID=1810916 RepID=UPI003CCDA852